MAPEKKEFTYYERQHTRVTWYKKKDGTLMAQNSGITERVSESGEAPPEFALFMGKGEMEVVTVLGEQRIGYGIPILGVTDIDAAFKKLDEADTMIQPSVVEAIKLQAKDEYDKMHSQLELPPGAGMPPQTPPTRLHLPG